MRFVLAFVLFVVAMVGIGLGVAQRTIFLGPDEVTSRISLGTDAPVSVIHGDALQAHTGTQQVTVSGNGPVFVAYGRTSDVDGWIGDATHYVVGYNAKKAALTSKKVDGMESTVPALAGSDLWIQEFSGTDQVSRRINVPADVSVIIASDGTAPAPNNVSISWPLDNSAPWSTPLLLGGGVVLLAGLGALVWALLHARKARGPRRKQPRMPRPPGPPRLKPLPRRRAITATAGTAVAPAHGRRRGFVVAPLVLVGALGLAGCSMGTPTGAGITPSATTVKAAADLVPTAVTSQQLRRIISRVSTVVAEADRQRDPMLAATRLAGPALDLRKANYTIRTADAKQAVLPAIPSDNVKVILPQQSAKWPRSVFAVVAAAKADQAPTALMLVQDTPRDNYKVEYAIQLDETLPQVAGADVGAARLTADSKFLAVAPNQLAAEYGDILLKGDKSTWNSTFDPDGDRLRTTYGAAYKADRKAKLNKSATLTFSNAAGFGPVMAFATNNAGAIVAVDLIDTETVKPREAGAAVNPTGAVKALSGKASSTTGIRADYGIQMLFYVPPVSGDGKVRLLGFSQGLVAAHELK